MRTLFLLASLTVVGLGQEFEGSANDDEDRPLRCYTGALGGRIETTCEPDVKHCTIHITKLGDSYFCGGTTEVEAYTCEDSSYVTKCDCPDDLCNVNSSAGGVGGAPNWLAVILVTVSAIVRLRVTATDLTT